MLSKLSGLLFALVFSPSVIAFAAPLTVTVAPVAAPDVTGFHQGASLNPVGWSSQGPAGATAGATLTVDNRSLRLNGRPWIPAMGEMHYARYPRAEWREALLRMKAGGISIVATYVFWIYHEEIEGQWDWSGQRDLREFVRLAGSLGLKVVVRCGPWAHGEVRNGGLPDWMLNRKDWQVRMMDPGFLGLTRGFYQRIEQQLHGLLWKDGGPVIGMQLDNEFGGEAAYLLALKGLAREVGLDVPLYTRTGWPALTTPMPFGEIVPLYGSYAEGFWDRELTSMPGRYWSGFRFSTKRIDENIANEQLGRREVQDAADVASYPYLTCEICGGMISSYHRRIVIDPADVESTVLIKVGSGSTLPGYYMYHGGTNPEGKQTTLMEAQDTLSTNYNDLPVKDYDYQAPLGQYGQIRPHYHLLRRLHLFLHDFGAQLAGMPPTLPAVIPQGKDDVTTLRWVVRSDGHAGYVFVSNYERARALPAKTGVQFAISLPSGPLIYPNDAVTVATDARFYWPFHLDLGHGLQLDWATAQPVCSIDEDIGRTIFFAETPGVPAQFAFAGENVPHVLKAGRGVAWERKASDGRSVRIVVLSEADSLALWKSEWHGRDRVFLTRAGLVVDGGVVRLTSSELTELSVGVYPAPTSAVNGRADGIFTTFSPKTPLLTKLVAAFELIQSAGPAREVRLGKASDPVAEQPSDADFKQAAVWRIKLPQQLDLSTDPILRIRYVGDVARIMLNGKMITDDFYNSNVWEIGLRRHAPEIIGGDLRIAILPLRKDSVTGPTKKVFMAEGTIPNFGQAESIAVLQGLEIVPRYEVTLPEL